MRSSAYHAPTDQASSADRPASAFEDAEERVPIAPHAQQDAPSRIRGLQQVGRFFHRAHLPARHLADHVSLEDSGLGGGASRLHRTHEDTLAPVAELPGGFLGQVTKIEAQVIERARARRATVRAASEFAEIDRHLFRRHLGLDRLAVANDLEGNRRPDRLSDDVADEVVGVDGSPRRPLSR